MNMMRCHVGASAHDNPTWKSKPWPRVDHGRVYKWSCHLV